MMLFVVMFSANCNTILHSTLAIGNSIKLNYSVVDVIQGNSKERGYG